MGLPGVVTIVSVDQAGIAESLAGAGAQKLMGWAAEVSAELYAEAIARLLPQQLRFMSAAAAQICDGLGAERVADRLH